MDIDEIRRKNLVRLEKEFGAKSVAERAGMSIAQFYNLRDGAKDSNTGKRRGMRKETAWRFEDGCGKQRGWLDSEIGESQPPLTLAPPVPYMDMLTAEEMHLLHLFRLVDKDYRAAILDTVRGIQAGSSRDNGDGNGDGETILKTGGA